MDVLPESSRGFSRCAAHQRPYRPRRQALFILAKNPLKGHLSLGSFQQISKTCPWLPDAPSDFLRLCKDFAKGEGDGGSELSQLALFALDTTCSASLSRAISRRVAAGSPLLAFASVKIALLGAWTLDYIADCLPAALARHGILSRLIIPAYDQILQEVFDARSPIYTVGADIALLAVDHRWLQLDRPLVDGPGAAVVCISQAIEKLRSVVSGLNAKKVPAILQTLPIPFAPTFGSLDRHQAGTLRYLILHMNDAIISLAKETSSYVLDVAAVAEASGYYEMVRLRTVEWFQTSVCS